jgi:hypothetical protein
MPWWAQILVLLIGGFHAVAGFFHFSRKRHGAVWAGAWALLTLVTAIAGTRALLAVFVVTVVLWNAWWASLRPRTDREWAPDVGRQTSGIFEGGLLTVRDVRCFDWRTETDFDERWETRSYELARLDSIDLFASYWASPSIAHLIVSFGFEGSDQLAFSIEVRRQRDELWSNWAGFFKAYELVTIAADERDIIRLRTTVRREDVYLYHLESTPELRERLLRAYIADCNRLTRQPRFYHTIITNCTTQIVRLVRAAGQRLPFDWRMIATGHVPEYLQRIGLIDRSRPFARVKAEAAISAIGQAVDRDPEFSARIRARPRS